MVKTRTRARSAFTERQRLTSPCQHRALKPSCSWRGPRGTDQRTPDFVFSVTVCWLQLRGFQMEPRRLPARLQPVAAQGKADDPRHARPINAKLRPKQQHSASVIQSSKTLILRGRTYDTHVQRREYCHEEITRKQLGHATVIMVWDGTRIALASLLSAPQISHTDNCSVHGHNKPTSPIAKPNQVQAVNYEQNVQFRCICPNLGAVFPPASRWRLSWLS